MQDKNYSKVNNKQASFWREITELQSKVTVVNKQTSLNYNTSSKILSVICKEYRPVVQH